MTDRIEVLEAALDCLLEGVLIFGSEGEVQFSNQAAEAILGYSNSELQGHALPDSLKSLQLHDTLHIVSPPGHGTLVHPIHKLGHEVPAIARTMILRDKLGEPIASVAFFHPAESLDALPHGDASDNKDIGESLAELEEHLRNEFEDFQQGGLPFGVIWISIDQATALRKTHGIGACQAMVDKVHHALSHGLRPGEELGRWGDNDFLIVAHERTPEMLAAHARTLAGLARTADFRWWGDRVSLTVSIGVAQVRRELNETLNHLLDRARAAMEISVVEGGNRITSAPKTFQQDSEAKTEVLQHSNGTEIDSGVDAGGSSCLPS